MGKPECFKDNLLTFLRREKDAISSRVEYTIRFSLTLHIILIILKVQVSPKNQNLVATFTTGNCRLQKNKQDKGDRIF